MARSARSPRRSCFAAGRADKGGDIRGMDIKAVDVRGVRVQAVRIRVARSRAVRSLVVRVQAVHAHLVRVPGRQLLRPRVRCPADSERPDRRRLVVRR